MESPVKSAYYAHFYAFLIPIVLQHSSINAYYFTSNQLQPMVFVIMVNESSRKILLQMHLMTVLIEVTILLEYLGSLDPQLKDSASLLALELQFIVSTCYLE